jgi:A/G-specific adenine glycosylase
VTSPDADRLRRRLREWFRRNRRDLPWRREPRDPWAVLVSEVMLQQTRVDVVVPRFDAFLKRWPTPEAMARSSEREVLAAWSGLGYYGRARRLHAAAKAIAGKPFPSDEASLRALPGVGPYTAGAVGSMAFGLPIPLMDGNVTRVLSRLFVVRDDPKRIREIAASLVPEKGAGEWNEGLMELGALVCVPGAPRCLLCPLAADCGARAKGIEESLPVLPPRAKPVAVRMAAALVRDGKGRTLLLRRPDGGQLSGMYELPSAEVGEDADPVVALCLLLHERLGGRWEIGAVQRKVRHSILQRRITLEVYGARPVGRRSARPEDSVFAAAEDLAELPLSSLVTKALAPRR